MELRLKMKMKTRRWEKLMRRQKLIGWDALTSCGRVVTPGRQRAAITSIHYLFTESASRAR